MPDAYTKCVQMGVAVCSSQCHVSGAQWDDRAPFAPAKMEAHRGRATRIASCLSLFHSNFHGEPFAHKKLFAGPSRTNADEPIYYFRVLF